ncbi:DUF421 domain-containing protein [Clostridium sediminicola]|uniref:DUF421 domain-containing protein n=1 Tax=Clostridium sediminicola TaxID=3114879 RepID=UPI0031F27534
MKIVLKSLLMIISGIILLRLSGRKSISQLSVVEAVVMISLGDIIIDPLLDENIPNTLLSALTFICIVVAFEILVYRFKLFEKIFIGKPIIVIKDGKIVYENLKKLRITENELYTRLRQNGMSTTKDIKLGVIEVNGQLGYELTNDAQPITKKDLQSFYDKIKKHQ